MKKVKRVQWNYCATHEGEGWASAKVGSTIFVDGKQKKVTAISTCGAEDRAWITTEGSDESTLTVFNINEIEYEDKQHDGK